MTALDLFQMHITKHEMYSEDDPNVKEALKNLVTSPIVKAGEEFNFMKF